MEMVNTPGCGPGAPKVLAGSSPVSRPTMFRLLTEVAGSLQWDVCFVNALAVIHAAVEELVVSPAFQAGTLGCAGSSPVGGADASTKWRNLGLAVHQSPNG